MHWDETIGGVGGVDGGEARSFGATEFNRDNKVGRSIILSREVNTEASV